MTDGVKELLACPFCGSPARFDGMRCAVRCTNDIHCSIIGPSSYDLKKTIERWNTRPAPQSGMRTEGEALQNTIDKLASFKKEDGFWMFRRDRNQHLVNGDVYTDAPFKAVEAFAAASPAALSSPAPTHLIPDKNSASGYSLQARMAALSAPVPPPDGAAEASEYIFSERKLLGGLKDWIDETKPWSDDVRSALATAREEIVLTIAFLGRDAGSDRLAATITSLIARLSAADKAIVAALRSAPVSEKR